MSQNISGLGNITTPLDSEKIASQKQRPEYTAQRMLRDAGPLMTKELDQAREMAVVPERDIPDDVLTRRNEETSETFTARELEDAVKREDSAAALSAAEKLEGKALTAQMQSLVKQAELLSAAVSPAQKQSVSALRDGHDVSAQHASLGQSAPVDDIKEVDADIDGPSEETLRELPMSEGLFTLLKDFQPGLLCSKALSLEEMQGYDDQLTTLISDCLFNKGADPEQAVILLRLMETQIQLENSMESRRNLARVSAEIDALEARRNSPPLENLDTLADMAILYHFGKAQTRDMQDVAAGNPQSLQEAVNGAGAGTGIVGHDLEILENRLISAMAHELGRIQSAEPALDSDSLYSLARLSLTVGKKPELMLAHLQKGLSWAQSPEYKNDLIKVLTAGVADATTKAGLADAAKRREAMSYVDMAFQGAYPEYADDALELKKLLLPDYDEEVELQHQCTVASRHLMNILFAGEGPSGKTRTDALARAMHNELSASARSFVLTPKLVDALLKKVDIPEFNFHLAHVAVLQKRAAEAGLFPLTDAEKKTMTDAAAWCRHLHLGEKAAAYAGNLDRDLNDPALKARCLRELERACGYFVRGFRGQEALSEAGHIIRNQAAMTESLSSGRKERAIYSTSPEYMAHLALDRHIVNLTGLIRPEERFAEGASDMTLDGAAVDDAMRRQTEALYTAILGNESPNDARRKISEKTGKQRMFLDDLQCFEEHAQTMTTLAQNRHEAVRLRRQVFEDEAHIKAMTEDKGLLHFTWPHRRAGQMRNCRTVLEIEKLFQDLSALPEDDAGREDLEQRINNLLETLHGVSPFTLASSLRRRKETPTLEIVLEQMLPRARALQFFREEKEVDGRTTTEATETLNRIKKNREDMAELQKGIDKSLSAVFRQFGKGNIRRLQQTIAAALYKVFTESQQPVTTFSILDEDTKNAVYEQLSTWGVLVNIGLTRQLVKLTLASLTSANGTLREESLRHEAENTPLDFSGKEKSEQMKARLREQGYSRFSAWKTTRDFINNTLLSDDRRRAEGIHALMREASLPGSGFVYDRTHGLVVDTGVLYTPFSSPNSPVNFVNLSHPLSVRLGFMAKDSMVVNNIGNDCYQVMLKGSFAATLGATMKVALPLTPLTLVSKGSLSGEGENGLALTFKNRQDCETFLNAFMKPDSGLHNNSREKYDPSIWLSATQIRFINGRTVSGALTGGLRLSLFKLGVEEAFTVSGSAMLSATIAGDVTRQVDQNAAGETTTFGVKGKITLEASASPGLSHGIISADSPKTTLKKALTMDTEQRFKIETGPQGLMPSCRVESEYMIGPLKNAAVHDIARWLLLPATVRSRLSENPAFSDALEKLLRGLPPTARLTVHRTIRSDVLEKTRALFIKARMSGREKEREEALKEAHRLLASFDSYVPVRISIKNVAPSDIAKNWSPGLAAFQYARNASFSRIRTDAPLSIPLPGEAQIPA